MRLPILACKTHFAPSHCNCGGSLVLLCFNLTLCEVLEVESEHFHIKVSEDLIIVYHNAPWWISEPLIYCVIGTIYYSSSLKEQRWHMRHCLKRLKISKLIIKTKKILTNLKHCCGNFQFREYCKCYESKKCIGRASVCPVCGWPPPTSAVVFRLVWNGLVGCSRDGGPQVRRHWSKLVVGFDHVDGQLRGLNNLVRRDDMPVLEIPVISH